FVAGLGQARWVPGALALLISLAVVIQGVAGARGLRARFAAGSALGAGLTLMISRSGDAGKPFESLMSGLIGAFFATIIGLLLGGLSTRLMKRLR
ncbi:MAG: hypothetical protein GY773_22420, partial [Actinomycetia bacterium]|nr:hypothetical protein [Actinomycetes bacterium]